MTARNAVIRVSLSAVEYLQARVGTLVNGALATDARIQAAIGVAADDICASYLLRRGSPQSPTTTCRRARTRRPAGREIALRRRPQPPAAWPW
jgi:hypothetical protein